MPNDAVLVRLSCITPSFNRGDGNVGRLFPPAVWAGDFVRGDQPNVVVGIHEDDDGLVIARLGFGEVAECGDNDNVARMHEVGGRSIDADDATAAGPLHRIGRQPGTPGDIPDMDFLEGQNVSRFEQVEVEREAPFVVQVGLGDGQPMQLRLEHPP